MVVAAALYPFESVTTPGYTLDPSGFLAYGVTTVPGVQNIVYSRSYTSELDSWAAIAIGNPAIASQGWYGCYPQKKAHGGSWGEGAAVRTRLNPAYVAFVQPPDAGAAGLPDMAVRRRGRRFRRRERAHFDCQFTLAAPAA